MESVFCPECGREMTTEDRFCSQCATPLREAMQTERRICRYCGNTLGQYMKFCPECGTQFGEEKPPQETVRYKKVDYRVESVFDQIEPEGRYKPISTGAYILLLFLFLCPGVGLLTALVLSFLAKRVALKRLASAAVGCWLILFGLLVLGSLLFFAFMDISPMQSIGRFVSGI